MKIEGILPVGSVVLLKEGNHRVMIIGYCQRLVNDPDRVFDYVGCLFPEGYINAQQNYLFNREQIDKIYHVGYQTDGQFAFAQKIEETLIRLRGE